MKLIKKRLLFVSALVTVCVHNSVQAMDELNYLQAAAQLGTLMWNTLSPRKKVTPDRPLLALTGSTTTTTSQNLPEKEDSFSIDGSAFDGSALDNAAGNAQQAVQIMVTGTPFASPAGPAFNTPGNSTWGTSSKALNFRQQQANYTETPFADNIPAMNMTDQQTPSPLQGRNFLIHLRNNNGDGTTSTPFMQNGSPLGGGANFSFCVKSGDGSFANIVINTDKVTSSTKRESSAQKCLTYDQERSMDATTDTTGIAELEEEDEDTSNTSTDQRQQPSSNILALHPLKKAQKQGIRTEPLNLDLETIMNASGIQMSSNKHAITFDSTTNNSTLVIGQTPAMITATQESFEGNRETLKRKIEELTKNNQLLSQNLTIQQALAANAALAVLKKQEETKILKKSLEGASRLAAQNYDKLTQSCLARLAAEERHRKEMEKQNFIGSIQKQLLADAIEQWDTTDTKLKETEKCYKKSSLMVRAANELQKELYTQAVADLRAKQLQCVALQNDNRQKELNIDALKQTLKNKSTFAHRCADKVDATTAWMMAHKTKTLGGIAALTAATYVGCWYTGRGATLPGMDSFVAPALNSAASNYINPVFASMGSLFSKSKAAEVALPVVEQNVPSLLLNPFS